MGFTVYLPRVFLQETGTTEAYGRVWMLKLWGRDAGFFKPQLTSEKLHTQKSGRLPGVIQVPIFGGNQTIQIYGNFAEFPL